MAVLAVTAANVVPSAAAVLRKEYTFAQTTTAGQAVYVNSSSQWALLQSTLSTGTAIGSTVGIAVCGGAVNQPAIVCTSDPAFVCGATLVNGVTIYGSTTAGGITSADIPTTGAFPVVLGIAKSTTVFNLSPVLSGVVI